MSSSQNRQSAFDRFLRAAASIMIVALSLAFFVAHAHADGSFRYRGNGYNVNSHCSYHSVYGFNCYTNSWRDAPAGNQAPVDMTPAPATWADKCGHSCIDLAK